MVNFVILIVALIFIDTIYSLLQMIKAATASAADEAMSTASAAMSFTFLVFSFLSSVT